MGDDAIFALDKYVVETKLFSSRLTFYDGNGNVVMREARGLFSGMKMETEDNRVLYSITHKVLSVPAVYEIHEGDKKGAVIGFIRFGFNLSMLFTGAKEIDILDANQNVVGKAVGDFMNYSYNIVDPTGNTAATITKSASGTLKNKLSQVIHSAYEIGIVSRAVPTNLVLGFAVVLEEVVRTQQRPGYSNMGGMGGFGTPGGFGGPMSGGFGGQGGIRL